MKARLFPYCLLVACLGLVSNAGLAQTSLDSLIEQADSIRTSDPAKFQRLIGELERRQGQATQTQQMKFGLLKAHGYLLKGESDPAVRELRKVMDGAEEDKLRFRAGAMLANTYAMTRRFEDGLRALNDTLPLVDAIKDRDIKHRGLLVAGVLYNQVGEFSLGLKYADQVLEDGPDGRSQCAAGNLRVEALLGLKQAPDEDAILASIQRCEGEGEPILAGFSRTYMAKKWFDEGEVKKATDLLERHLPEVEATGYPRLVGEYHAMLASFNMKQGRVETAEEHAKKAVAQSSAIFGSMPLVIAYKTLFEVAELRRDPVAALQQYRNYAEADKAYLNDVKARELAYQIVRQQIQQKNQQIDVLDQQNQVLTLQRKVDQQAAQNTRLIVILLVVLVASIGYWAFKIKRVQLSLKKMAETDALTGICNRHHFTLRAERALAECARNGEQAALIMFDLDHFKNINDRFGHETGDWALTEVAEACKGFCRRIDVLGRLGGEEFAILMYGCDLRAAARAAEDCRVRLAQIDTKSTGHTFAITGSFGVTSSALAGYSLAKLLSHADRMLYRAKHLGRNRVCIHEPAQDNARDVGSNVLELPHRDGRVEHHTTA